MILKKRIFLISTFLTIIFSFLIAILTNNYNQEQPPRGVLSRRCSENMQQIYRRTPMLKCDFNKNALILPTVVSPSKGFAESPNKDGLVP